MLSFSNHFKCLLYFVGEFDYRKCIPRNEFSFLRVCFVMHSSQFSEYRLGACFHFMPQALLYHFLSSAPGLLWTRIKGGIKLIFTSSAMNSRGRMLKFLRMRLVTHSPITSPATRWWTCPSAPLQPQLSSKLHQSTDLGNRIPTSVIGQRLESSCSQIEEENRESSKEEFFDLDQDSASDSYSRDKFCLIHYLHNFLAYSLLRKCDNGFLWSSLL